MFNGKIHHKWSFSIAMLVITRGYILIYSWTPPISQRFPSGGLPPLGSISRSHSSPRNRRRPRASETPKNHVCFTTAQNALMMMKMMMMMMMMMMIMMKKMMMMMMMMMMMPKRRKKNMRTSWSLSSNVEWREQAKQQRKTCFTGPAWLHDRHGLLSEIEIVTYLQLLVEAF